MDAIKANCQTQGVSVDISLTERTLVYIERTTDAILQNRFRCPLCDTIEMHSLELDEDTDVVTMAVEGGYDDFVGISVTRDPSIFSIQKKLGHFTGVKAAQIAGAIRNLKNADDFINPQTAK